MIKTFLKGSFVLGALYIGMGASFATDVEAALGLTKKDTVLKKDLKDTFEREILEFRYDLGDAKAIQVAESLKGNTIVKKLIISSCPVSNGFAKALAEVLKVNTSITWLDFDQTQIGNEGVVYLIEALTTNKKLESLTITNSRYINNDIDATKIEKCLKECRKNNSPLKYLDFHCGNSINEQILKKMPEYCKLSGYTAPNLIQMATKDLMGCILS